MALYALRFFTWGCWSVLFSFFAVWLTGVTPFSAAEVSVLAGTLALANRAGCLLCVRWVERCALRTLMLCTQAVLVLALLGLDGLYAAGNSNWWLWLPCAALFGLASSVSSLAQLSFIASGQTRADTLTAFSLENVALNLSAGVTPYASAWVLNHCRAWYLLVPLLYVLPALLLCLCLPNRPCGASTAQAPAAAPPAALAPWRFLLLNGLTFLAFSLFYNVFPLHAAGTLGAEQVGLLFAASSALIVLLQVPLTRLSRGLGHTPLLLAANASLALGLWALYSAHSHLGAAALAIGLLTLAEMIFGPVYQALAVRVFPGRPARAMAIVTLTWASAETLATAGGLYGVAQGQGLWVFAVGVAAALLACALLRPRLSSA
ncbi:MFS transporter [Pseudomonas sp. NPDC007930]|uniref:MFS transporter n=1 Tax=Pseudomonas sp. NPDC007930 TaxID=3364417 RepID=UPI0036EB45DE